MKDKVVIVTGASSGIGMACTKEFARAGAKVVAAARNYDIISSLCDELNGKGYDAFAVKTDVSVEEECKRLVESAASRYGRIDVLVNNAGISMRALFEEADLQVIRRVMDINFWGTVYCTKFALPYLLKGKGTVVGISSVAGYVGLPARTGYSASKFAVQGFLEALRTENRKKGLHVLIAAPGFTASHIRKTALLYDGSPQGDSPRKEKKMMPAEKVAVFIKKAVEKRKPSLVLTFEGKLTVFLKKFTPRILEKLVYNNMAKEPDSPFDQ